MRLLLDTNALIWAIGVPDNLPGAIQRLIVDPKNSVSYSVASIFEIATKRSSGRRHGPLLDSGTTMSLADEAGYLRLDIDARHVIATESLAPFHSDPFDKLILAQAQVEDMTLITSDEQLASYDARVVLF